MYLYTGFCLLPAKAQACLKATLGKGVLVKGSLCSTFICAYKLLRVKASVCSVSGRESVCV